MNLEDALGYTLFSLGEFAITFGQLMGFLAVVVFLYWIYRLLSRRLLPHYFSRKGADLTHRKRINRIVRLIFLLLVLIVGVIIFQLDLELYSTDAFTFRVSTILEALLIIQVARLLDWIVSKVMLHDYYMNRDAEKKAEGAASSTHDPESKATRTIQYIVYIISALFIIRAFNINDALFDFSTPDQVITFRVSNLLIAVLIILSARLFSWVLVQLVLYGYYKRSSINVGSQYAINQLLKYVIYIIAVLMALDHLGIQMTLIWGGAAALLVGVGLGLQQTFNDLISGIILLFERSVEVEDVVEIDGLVGKVKKIGLRTSLVETFDNITVIVPNSKLIVDNVINWSHYDDKARFDVSVGVAYGSDTALVKKVLLQVAQENVYILDYPTPLVRFVNFGDSSLDFELHFWTRNFIVIEDIKSDVRFAIDQKFREHDINIPFPQRDVWNRT